MVKEKYSKEGYSLRDALARMDEKSPVINIEWSVYEITPGYNTGGYYDQDIPQKEVEVSNRFDTECDAVDWMDQHVADDGKYLEVFKHITREHRYLHCSSFRTLIKNKES